MPKTHQGGEQDGYNAVARDKNPRIFEFVEIEMCICCATAGNPVHAGGRSAAPQPSQGLVLKVFCCGFSDSEGTQESDCEWGGSTDLHCFPNSLISLELFPYSCKQRRDTRKVPFPPDLKRFSPHPLLLFHISKHTAELFPRVCKLTLSHSSANSFLSPTQPTLLICHRAS